MNKLPTIIANEEVELFADRALFWCRERTLFVADPHFGKANTFQKFGVPLRDDTATELDRLTHLITATGAERIVFLGDFVHSKTGTTDALRKDLTDWMAAHGQLHLTLVKGNHDRGFHGLENARNLDVFNRSATLGPFLCSHEPIESDDQHVLCGHLHPGFVLRERNGPGLRCSCFWLRPRVTVLPAFGSFTGTKPVRPEATDQIVVTGDGIVKRVR